MIKLLIDGDELAFFASVNAMDLLESCGNVERSLDYYNKILKFDEFEIFFSCKVENGFRRNLFPGYKMNRKTEKPLYYHRTKECMELEYPSSSENGLEADDLLGIHGSESSAEKRIMITQDKDILTIPGLSFNPRKADLGIKETSLEEANYNLAIQILSGDSTDNYKGIPRIGPKKAEKLLLDKPDHSINTLREIYISEFNLSEEYFNQNHNCARILRFEDYCFETKTIKSIL